jgi:hypothetical protein
MQPWESVALTTQHYLQKAGTNFADKGVALGQYSSVTEFSF